MTSELIQLAIFSAISIPFFLIAFVAPDWIFMTEKYQSSIMGSLSIRTSRMFYAGLGGFFVLLAIIGATGNLERLMRLIDKIPT